MSGRPCRPSVSAWLPATCVLAAAASMLAVASRVPLGPGGQWRRCYAEQRDLLAAAQAACALAAFACLCVAASESLRSKRRAVKAGVLAAATVGAGWVALAVCTAGPFGVAELTGVFMFPGANGSYFSEAEKIGPYSSDALKRNRALPVFSGVREYLARYADYVPSELFPGDTVRVGTHPPGPALCCYAVQLPLRRWPALADRLLRCYRAVFRSEIAQATFLLSTPPSSRLFVAGATAAGLCTLTLASLTGLAAWAAARLLGVCHGAALALGLCALLPSVLLYSPGIDQCFPLLALLLGSCFGLAARLRPIAFGAAAGLMLYGCLLFSLAFLVPLLVVVVYAALSIMFPHEGHETASARARMGRVGTIACASAVGFAAAAMLSWALLGYDTLGTLMRCFRYNAQFNATARLGYWPWLVYTPLVFVLFMGGPAAVVWLAGTALALRRTWSERRVLPADRLALATLAVVALLLVSGQNRGEIDRLWMFLMPLCVLAGLAAIDARAALGRRHMLWMLLAQSAQVVVFRVCYDAWDIARYIAHDLL